MVKHAQPTYDVGVIVGRFQTPELHEGHRDLIEEVLSTHSSVIIFLGLSPLKGIGRNCLDFFTRKKMIQEAYPEINVLYIDDVKDDVVWSKKLDREIEKIVSPRQTVGLYGSRDSFIAHYKGKYPTVVLEAEVMISATEIRNTITKEVQASADFRKGVIYNAFNRFPTVYTTVDIAIFNEDYTKVLLGRKPDEKEYRFIGGFADPRSDSFEQDAKREAKEETGSEVGDIQYIGSFKIDDWRYRNEDDKIKTLFFKAKHLWGPLKADDDIAEIRWFDFSDLKSSELVEGHRVLLLALKDNMNA